MIPISSPGIPGGPALVAIDLGAESCRVSLLTWERDQPRIQMIRRFANAPQDCGAAGFHWDLDRICSELEAGLRDCAERVASGIAAIGVTGWAVDYVRLDAAGRPIAQPFCYRDPRHPLAMRALHAIVPAAELYAITGVQIQPINTIYQLFADKQSGIDNASPWVNLPEYILHWLGAPRIAEYTNATHTALVNPISRQWSDEIFAAADLDRSAAPELVSPGTALGPLRSDLRSLPAFADTQLIAPACHDTASAIAGIPQDSANWAYHSCGTWSLIGTLLPQAARTEQACDLGFTNLGAADGRILFHRGIPGMWLLRQCMNLWDRESPWKLEDLIAAARRLPAPDALLDLDDPAFGPPGDMTVRINAQRQQHGLAPLPDGCSAAPHYANLIFHSLAVRCSALLQDIQRLTGSKPDRLRVVGGGSRNEYLNALTAQAAGIPVERCSVESSTLGNFALQWACLESPSRSDFPRLAGKKVSALSAVQIS